MVTVLRAAFVYLFMLTVVRATGRRTLGEMTPFDLVLMLIISEATQNAMIGDDFSLTNAALGILTLLGLALVLTFAKRRSSRLDRCSDGAPTILAAHGRRLAEVMTRDAVG